jgi:phosphate transport system substrate-binding protein
VAVVFQPTGDVGNIGGAFMTRNAVNLTAALALVMTVAALPPAAGAQQQITIDGSTGTAPLVGALGKAFAAKHNITVELGKGLGAKARFEALSAAKIDIAMASHGLKVSDIAAMGMTVHRIALTPVVFAVHETIGVGGLTEAQICAIYSTPKLDWKNFGGPGVAVAALARPDSEVDAEVVRDGIGCFKALKLADGIRVLERAGDMARALAETTGAIGMTSATVVEQSKGKIKALALNGVAPSEANVLSGHYRLTRDSFLVTRNAPSPQVKAFLDFVNGSEGAAVIKANGALVAPK